MKRLAIVFVVAFAWLLTTDQVMSIKAVGDNEYTVSYQKYCVDSPKKLSPDSKGRYSVTTVDKKTMYIPASSTIVEQVTKCP